MQVIQRSSPLISMFQLIVEEGNMTIFQESLQLVFLNQHTSLNLQEKFKMCEFPKKISKNPQLTMVPLLVPAFPDLPEDVRRQHIPK